MTLREAALMEIIHGHEVRLGEMEDTIRAQDAALRQMLGRAAELERMLRHMAARSRHHARTCPVYRSRVDPIRNAGDCECEMKPWTRGERPMPDMTSPELYECIHCGQEDTTLDHWESCPSHPARARIAELERMLRRNGNMEGCEFAEDLRTIHYWATDWRHADDVDHVVEERDALRARVAELEDALRTKDAMFRTMAARDVQWAERAKAAEAVLRDLAVESDHHDEDCPVNDWYERGDWPPNYVACLCRLAPWTKGEADA